MSTHLPETDALAALLAKAPAAGLTAAEVDQLRRGLDVLRTIEVLGRAARLVVVTLGVIAAGIAAWDVVLGRLRIWLVGS